MYYDDAEGNRVYTMLVRLSSTLCDNDGPA